MTTITIDLARLDGPADVRAMGFAATTILCVLPHDEARVAVDRWLAIYRVEPEKSVSRETAAKASHETGPRNDDFVEDVAPEPTEARVEHYAAEEVVTTAKKAATGSSHDYRGVTYREKPRGRGAQDRKPEAAYAVAYRAVANCKTVDELETARPELIRLSTWFMSIGYLDLDRDLTEAVALRFGQLVNAEDIGEDADGRAIPPTVEVDDDGEVTLEEVAEVEAEAAVEPDDVPFEAGTDSGVENESSGNGALPTADGVDAASVKAWINAVIRPRVNMERVTEVVARIGGGKPLPSLDDEQRGRIVAELAELAR